MKKQKRLIVMAGGTGGHIFPGIAVSHYLMNKNWKVQWLGTADHMEADLVPKYGIEINFIHISNSYGKTVKEFLMTPAHILYACYQARAIMKIFKPDVVLGMGGYVSCPSGLAAWSLGIPIVLHEQNSVVGLTNKWLSKLANRVMQAFPGAFPNAKVVGNPIRTDVLDLLRPEVRMRNRKGPIRVLVIGGSQGARILNQIMPKVSMKLKDMITVWHQSGKGLKGDVERAYSSIGESQYKVSEFIDDIAEAYDWADVVVCRSGALTVSEIAVVGLPAIFVPFQHRDRQQYWNALLLEKVGAAKIFEQSKFTADTIADNLSSWDREVLIKMAQRARSIAILDSTEQVAREINLAADLGQRCAFIE